MTLACDWNVALVCVYSPCAVGYENEVLAGEVSQVQAYKDRIDEMDSMTLHAAHLEKTNARCGLRTYLTPAIVCT